MWMINKTKDRVMGEHVMLADTFWKRLKGLLGTSSLPRGHGLIITPCNSVHTFGMAYPIDVLFVDRNHRIIKIVHKDHRVLKIVENMGSGKMSMASGSGYVVELPAGTAQETECSVGDVLEWK